MFFLVVTCASILPHRTVLLVPVLYIEAGTPLSAAEREDYIILSRVFALRVKS